MVTTVIKVYNSIKSSATEIGKQVSIVPYAQTNVVSRSLVNISNIII